MGLGGLQIWEKRPKTHGEGLFGPTIGSEETHLQGSGDAHNCHHSDHGALSPESWAGGGLG